MTGAAPRRERIDLLLLLALTFSTGIVDAVGFLGLGQVFIANMTGNVLILGMGIAGAGGLPVLGPVVALGGFCAGIAIAGAAYRGRAKGWRVTTTVLLVAVGLVLLLGAGMLFGGLHRLEGWSVAVTAILGGAMGMQAGVARHIAVTDVTTVVVTSTLVALIFESTAAGGRVTRWARRVTAVALLLAGALVGALLLRTGADLARAAAGAVTITVAVVGQIAARTAG